MEERSSTEWYRTGRGYWDTFRIPFSEIKDSTREWSEIIKNVKKPWLCWNVDPAWCLVQQKLVDSIGWIPIVGSDPRAKKPILIDSSIYINFNKIFNLPTLTMHFPVEFSFMFCDKLAFWHSDLLVQREKLKNIAEKFESLKDGDMVVTVPKRSLRMKLLYPTYRYWELIGCTTKAASMSQFENGAGWFSNIQYHPNCPKKDFENRKKKIKSFDHGWGIKYWEKYYKPESSKIYFIKESYVEEGHCTRIRNKKYKPQSPNNLKRDLSKDLTFNYNLTEECNRLGIAI